MNALREHLLCRRLCRCWMGFVALLGLGATAAAQLVVVTETFTGTTMSSDWVVGGSNYTPNLTAASGIDPAGSGWLRLTSAGGQQATYAYDSQSFNGTNATIAVKFSYAAYGGTGADGITFFLADASKTFSVGAYGGSLGYAQKTLAGGGEADIQGMNGGYIGLGLDEFGNYSNPTEGRIGGEGFFPGNVSIRGPGQGFTGYEYLGGTGQLTTPIAFTGTTRPTGDNARVFQVVLTATNQLTVYMQAGATAPMEALYSIDLSGYARPEDLILGFTGSTGGSTNIHEIQGLNLTSLKADQWTNAAGTSTWANGSNWDGTDGNIPIAGADILLDNVYVSTPQTIDVGGTRVIRSIQIDAPFSYTLNNGTLQFDDQDILGPSGIFVSQGHGSANHTIGSALVLTNAIEIANASSGTLALTGSLANGGNNVSFSGTGVTSLSGPVSGTGGILKRGSGEVILSGNNTYSGGTTLRDGTITLGHNNALGSGALTIFGGTLGSNAGNTASNAISLQGNARLSNITTAGTLTQTGGNRTLTLSGATHSGAINLSENNTARTLTVAVDAGSSTISGAIQNGGTGAGGLTKSGSGTLVLGGANTYTGGTTISAGTLQLGASDRLADTGSVSIGGSGTLALGGFSERIGNLTAVGGATLDFGATSGANTFVFGTYTPPASGVLVVNNWEQSLDKLASTVGSQTVSSIYFSGFGVAQQATSQTAMGGIYGNAYLLTPVSAIVKEWDGSSSNTWATDNNWTTPVEPDTNEIALFDDLGVGRANPNLGTSDTIAGIRFGTGASVSYNLTGSTNRILTLAGAVPFIQQQSANSQSIAIQTVALGNNTVADITGSGDLNISSRITGTGYSLVKDGNGAGKLVLSGNNTFSGGVFINLGTVQANSNTALGTGAATVYQGATLEVAGSRTITNALTLAGHGVASGGALRSVSGTNTLSGAITESAATRINADAGTLTLTGEITGTNTNTTFGGAGNITVGSAASGRIATGSGTVTIDGTGTVTFTGGTATVPLANTYTGTTFVNSGTLVLDKTPGTSTPTNAIAGDLVIGDGSGAASSATVRLAQANQIRDQSNVTINSDGLFNLNGVTETISNLAGSGRIDNTNAAATTLRVRGTGATTFSGQITDTAGNLTLIKQDGGKLTLTGANGYAGGTTIESGILAIGHNTALGTGTVTVNSGGNLELFGGLTNVANAFNLNGPGTLANDGAIQSTAGSNVVSGAITLQSQTRIMADAGSTLTLSGGIGGAGQALTVGGAGSTTISGVIGTGAGTLTKDGTGTVTLSGANTYTGATTVSAGTLRLGANNALSDSTAVTVAGGASLNVNNTTDTIGSLAGAGSVALGSGSLTTGNNNTSTEFTGVISGSGNLTKSGTGTFTLSGANTLTGAVTLAGSSTSGLTLANTSGQALGGITSITVNAANTLSLGASHQLSDTANLILAGGTFAANGFSETMRQVSMTSDSTIDYLNDGSVLRFNGQIGSVSGLGTLTGTLTIANWAGDLGGGGTEQLVVYSPAGAPTVSNIAFSGWGGATTIDRSDLGNGFWEIVPQITGIQWGLNGNGIWNNNTGNWRVSTNGAVSPQPNAQGAVAILGDYWNGTAFAPLTTNPTIDLQTNNRTVGKLIFDNSADRSYTVGTGSTGRLDFNMPGFGTSSAQIIVSDDGAHTINANGAVADPLLITNNSSAPVGLTFAANRTLDFIQGAATSSLTVNGSGTTRIDGRITRAGTYGTAVTTLSLVKTGTGTLILANANGFNGTTTLRSGTLRIDNAGALGTSSLTINDASTTEAMNTTFVLGAPGVTFAAPFTVGAQGGTTTLGGVNTSGTATFSGTITLNKDVSLTAAAGGTVVFSGALNSSANADITVGGAGNTTISGVIGTGGGSLTKTDAGTLTLSGNNTFTGGTLVSAGTLQLTGAGRPGGAASTTTVADGATLALSSLSSALNRNLSLTGAGLGGNGAVQNVAGANTLSGGIALTGTTTVGVSAGSLTASGAISGAGGLIKTGSGTLTLSNASSSYAGTTTLRDGTLVINANAPSGSNGALGNGTAALQLGDSGTAGANNLTLQLDNATGGRTVGRDISVNNYGNIVTLAGSNTSGTNTFGGSVSLAKNITTTAATGGTLAFTGAISGTGGLTVGSAGNTGSVVLSGNSTYGGATTVAYGTLIVGSTNALGSTAGGTTVNAGATLGIQGDVTLAGESITLTAAAAPATASISSLTGANTVSGPITLAGSAGHRAVINATNGTLTLGAIGQTGGAKGVTTSGAGNIILAGANTFSDSLVLNGSTGAGVTLGATGSLGAVSSITINTGNTLSLGANNQINDSANLVLAGGTLNVGSFSETMRQMSMTASSAIDYLDDGSILRFNGASGVSGLGSLTGTLTINNWAGSLDGSGTEQLVVYSTSGAPTVSAITFDGWGSATTISRSDLGTGYWEIIPNITGIQWGINGNGVWNNNTGNWRNSQTGAVSAQPNLAGAVVILGNYWNGSAWAPLTNNPTINLEGNTRTVGRLIFENSANRSYTISGTGQLNFDVSSGAAQIIVNDDGSHTISAPVRYADNFTITNFSSASAGLTISNSLGQTVNGTRTLTFDGTGNTAVTGVITDYSGTTNLVKVGSGTLTLGGAANNTFAGTTLLRNGTIIANKSVAFGGSTSAIVVNDSGTLSTANTAVLIGATGVTLNRQFTIGSQGASTTLGGASTLTSGTGTFSNTITLNRSIELTAAGTSNITFSGRLADGAGTNNITKVGTGTVTLSNTGNNYDGSTTIAAGTLQLGASNVLPDATALALTGANTTLNLANNSDTIGSLAGNQATSVVSLGSGTLTTGGSNASTQFDGTITGTGALTKAGSGTMTLTGANTYSGTTTISGGTLQIGAGGTTGTLGTGGVVNNGSLVINRSNAYTVANAISGTGSLTQAGAGVTTLSGANSYSGGTQINAGTLSISADNNLGTGSLTFGGSGGTLQTTTNLTTTRAATINSATATFNTAAGTMFTYGGAIGGTGGLTKIGTGYLALGGANTYSGNTLITDGAIVAASSGALGSGGNTSVSSGATLALQNNVTIGSESLLTLNGNGVLYSGVRAGALANESGNNTWDGAITLGSNADIYAYGGSLRLGPGGDALTLGSSTLRLGAMGTSAITAESNIAGSGAVIAGNGTTAGYTGTVTLSGNNSYSGGTTLESGTLRATTATALGTGSVSMASGTTLQLAGNSNTNFGRNTTVTGTGAATITVDRTSAGTGVTHTMGTLSVGSQLNVRAGTNLASNTSYGVTFGDTTITGATTFDVANNGTGTGTLSLGNTSTGFDLTKSGAGTLEFSGTLTATNLTLLGGTLTLGGDASIGTLTIGGGTLRLTGADLAVGTLHITGNTILDFGSGVGSSFIATDFLIEPGVIVTVNNWVDGSDFFAATNSFVQNGGPSATPGVRGTAPQNQIVFDGFSGNSTGWLQYNNEISPVPEPSTYGLIFLGGCVGFFAWRRWRKQPVTRA